MRKLMSSMLLLGLSVPALADPIPLPEPGSLSLVGLGIGLAVWLAASKRKK